MFFKSKKVIGLDIGSSTIKAAELEVRGDSATLLSFGVGRTPAGSVNGGEINDTTSLSTAVQSLVAELGTKRKAIATGIWGSAVIIKKISLPRMEASLIGEQIRWEAEQYIPFDINDINLEFYVLKKPNQNPEAMEVLLVAAKKEIVFKYAETIETAGLQCSVLDVSSFALANCFSFNYELPAGAIAGLLDIGSGVSNFVVMDNAEIVFCRDIPVGGSTYTGEIQRNMEISAEEAEQLKISAAQGQATPAQVQDVITATHEAFCDEVRRTYDFYVATGSDTQIQKLFVTGGAVGTPGLLERISQTLQVPAEIFNPFANLKYDTRRFTPEYISSISAFSPVAIGLGLRKVGDR
ncbi:MAG TPA: type IV pilus assembly protein PilM [Bdellovibrionales bacterium]|nr:type IV pilus assembly protein PilM [Bdellovibrionales bacterium]